MKIRLALGAVVPPPYRDEIASVCEIIPVGSQHPAGCPTEEALRQQCRGCEIVYLGAERVSAPTLADWKEHGLRLLGCARSNPVNIDLGAAKELGIPVVYTPGRNAQSVAEMTIALILVLARRIALASRRLADGTLLEAPKAELYQVEEKDDVIWKSRKVFVRDVVPQGIELYGRTLGVVAFGAIGSRVARLGLAFGMDVLAYDPFCPRETIEQAGAKAVSLEELLARSDVVSLHLPVNKETRKSVNMEWFSRMKSTAVLINTARAALVDQQALVEALEQGTIAGAALDVMWEEPCPANHPLLQMDQVVITPHIGGWTDGVERWQSRMIVEEILRYARGEAPVRVWKR